MAVEWPEHRVRQVPSFPVTGGVTCSTGSKIWMTTKGSACGAGGAGVLPGYAGCLCVPVE
ncbi:hypothetical protein SAMN06272781_7385 [Streptomyces sp. 1222.2]|uniref:Uncharacterized protein n=1 Tax=Streptomyces stelliscabiei TaxID=146820 RepID=A0A8I0P2J2_9ACTN|nr:hypothetical protein [Streptomyces stelliscabiei]SOD81285.1 hypothetical protein SAMN06272781_7385 [Streptomyces sp. 1222.2]